MPASIRRRAGLPIMRDHVLLYVNGRRFATGRLLLIDQTEWAVQIERVLDPDAAYATSHEGGI